MRRIDSYLAACQLGITIASIGLGVVGKPALQDLLEPLLGEAAEVASIGLAGAMAFGIVTLLHVVVGELAPKSLAIARTDRTVLWVAPPMRVFYLLTKPVVDLFNGMGNLLLRPFGVPPAREAGHAPHSEDELRALVRDSLRGGLILPEEHEFAENVFTFGDRRTREIMRPRSEIDYVTTGDTLRDAAAVSRKTGHTRLPLCEADGGLDAPVGVIHAKDLLDAAIDGADGELRELARPLARVSESTLVDQLLRELRRDRRHIALVSDEHGTTIGLVTLEDVLEEIVGEIEDEFDPQRRAQIVREPDGIRVDGGASLREVAEELGLEVDEHHEAPIGGHALELLGRLPQVGETIEIRGAAAEVTAVEGARIAQLRFLPRAGAGGEAQRGPDAGDEPDPDHDDA